MIKKIKVLILLALITLCLILYLIFIQDSAKPTDNKNGADQQIKQNNSVLLENDYKIKASEFFAAYEKLANNNSFTRENITELRNKLLDLKGIPKKFQELHYEFVLALDKMNDYLSQKNEQKKSDSLEIINRLKADYSNWLNN
ncbi:MAG: hypothetical protein WCL13_00360 [bacterium]